MKTSKLIGYLIALIVLSSLASSETFQYDANGNLVRDGTKCYQYNGANQLENVTNCAGTIIAQYWYDYTGRKIQAVENGTTIYYPFPGFESRVNGSRLENTTYIYANGELVARNDSSGMHYYHGDQLGSTSLITNSSGGVEEKTKYLPYGGIRSGGTKTKYLYNGKELVSATGLYDYGARPYNWQMMHFIMPDGVIQNPTDPQTLNRYAYVRNNPVRYTDPSGNEISETVVDYSAFVVLAAFATYELTAYTATHSASGGASPDNKEAQIAHTAVNSIGSAQNAKNILDTEECTINAVSGKGTWNDVGVQLASSVAIGPAGELGIAAKAEEGLTLSKTSSKIKSIMSYEDAQQITKGQGGEIQAHHLVDQRFKIGDPAKSPALVLTKAEHNAFTQASRSQIQYGSNYGNLPMSAYLDAIDKTYEGSPVLARVAKTWITNNYQCSAK